jgi:hypothetical protein
MRHARRASVAFDEAVRLVRRLNGATEEEPAPPTKVALPEEEWTSQGVEDRLRIAGWDEVRRCPKGQEAVVEEIHRRLADEFLGQRMRWMQITKAGWDRLGLVAMQLSDPRPGQRLPIRKRQGSGNVVGFLREPSTFPDDMFGITRDLHGVDRLKDVIEHVTAGKLCGEAERRVLDWALSWSDPEDVPRLEADEPSEHDFFDESPQMTTSASSA